MVYQNPYNNSFRPFNSTPCLFLPLPYCTLPFSSIHTRLSDQIKFPHFHECPAILFNRDFRISLFKASILILEIYLGISLSSDPTLHICCLTLLHPVLFTYTITLDLVCAPIFYIQSVYKLSWYLKALAYTGINNVPLWFGHY